MTELEIIRAWIATYSGYGELTDFYADYTEATPSNGGVFPGGLSEISRTTDIIGNVRVTNQYNFSLYFVFAKAPGDDMGAAKNAEWLMALQEWVQAQSATGQAPVFGDIPKEEKIMAQNGTLYGTDDEGTAMYSVQLSVQFIKKYEVKNEWLT